MAQNNVSATSEFIDSPIQLGACSPDELEQIFSDCSPLKASEMDGDYTGKLYGIPGISRLPNVIGRLLTKALNTPSINFIWRGKSFENGEGSNLWLSGNEPSHFVNYTYAKKGKGELTISYDIDENPAFLKPMHAHLRRLSDDIVLGKVFAPGGIVLFMSLRNVESL